MNKHGEKPSEELKHFTNRDNQKDVFRRHVNAVAGTGLPVVMFYGVGGIGKTWLTKRLRAMLEHTPDETLPLVHFGETAIPSARLDLDVRAGGGDYISDSARTYAQIRLQLGVECPRFDLAYAMLRHSQNAGAEPSFRQGGALHSAWELINEAGSAALSGVPGGNLIQWAIKKLAPHVGKEFQKTALYRWLLSNTGNAEFLELLRMDVDDLYRLLPEYLGADLDAHLPERPDKACRGVVFIDTFETIQKETLSDAQQYEREHWVVRLFECTRCILLVLAGQNRLIWAEMDADWRTPECLEQHLIGGLSAQDAGTFLGWCGVTDGILQRAVMRVCVDIEEMGHGDVPYHPYSLGLCADTIAQERAHGVATDPASFDMAPGDNDKLVLRFLRALDDTQKEWVTHLALPPRFDEAAARAAFSLTRDRSQDAAWRNLIDYSFVSEAQGWRTLHARMRDALRRRLTDPANAEDLAGTHQWWHNYWLSRAQNDTNGFAALAWYHSWCLDAETARAEWNVLAEQARGSKYDMALHSRLLDWWLPTGIEGRKPTQSDTAALNDLGTELTYSTLGIRRDVINRAIACYRAALRVYTETEFPQDWAMTQNNLGNAYRNLPTGDRAANLQSAIRCYEAALRVRTETEFPQQWAMTQQNLAAALFEQGDQRKAIEAVQAAIRGYRAAGLDQEAQVLVEALHEIEDGPVEDAENAPGDVEEDTD